MVVGVSAAVVLCAICGGSTKWGKLLPQGHGL